MFTLTVPDQDITGGSIPIAWCLDHESIKFLMDRGNTNPTILIVVAPQKGYHIRKESRYVCSLSELMTYISFLRPGHNKVFAIVCKSSVAGIKDDYLSKHGGEFRSNVLRASGDRVDSYFDSNISTSIDIDVPLESFAKEPSEWEKSWVLWLVKDKGLDQCDFRRKRLFAYTVQPFIMLGNLLLRFFITLISAGLLLKGFSLRGILHPLTTSFEDLNKILSGRMYLYKPRNKFYSSESPRKFISYVKDYFITIKIYFLVACSPLISVSTAAIIYFSGADTGLFLLAMLLLLLGAFAVAHIGIWAAVYLNLFLATKKEDKNKSTPLKDKEELDLIICNPNSNSFVNVASLPRKKRTIKLRYQQLKSKICRPFPG